MALEWIKSHKELERHPKTLRLMSLMRWSLNETIGFLHRFWWWALDVAPDGVVTDVCLPGVMDGAFGFKQSLGDKVLDALKASGWLDVREDGEIVIHNHERRRSASPEQIEGNRERKRRQRERENASRACHAHVTRDENDVTLLDKDKDIDQETTHTSACENQELSMSDEYRLVLDTYRGVTGISSKDASVRDGALVLARALRTGDMRRDVLEHVIRTGMSDPGLPNQTLRGVSRNFTKYLPGGALGKVKQSKRFGFSVSEIASQQGEDID